jgi:hypothetical protein
MYFSSSSTDFRVACTVLSLERVNDASPREESAIIRDCRQRFADYGAIIATRFRHAIFISGLKLLDGASARTELRRYGIMDNMSNDFAAYYLDT